MIAPETLRKAQLIMLEMLVEFDAVCNKHQLRYWLDSGTLLGAVRHKGFIPWDDDIDISMPLEDYQQFLSVAGNELSNEIFLQNSDTDKHFKFDYTKLRSNKARIVELHEKGRQVNYHQGVFVDIFPMLTMANSEENKTFYDNTLSDIRAASAISLHTPGGVDEPTRRAELTESLRKKHQGWDNITTKVIYGGEMPDVSAWFDIGKVLPTGKIEFEGNIFPAPNDPHHYLSSIYSFNYTEIPPEDKRKIHAHSIEFTV